MAIAQAAPPSASIWPAAVVDASIWVARFIRSDPFHAPSTSWLYAQLAGGARLAAPSLLLVEVAGALARQLRQTQSAARAARVALRTARQLEHEPQMVFVSLDSLLTRLAYETAAAAHLRGADAVYVRLARELGVPFYSWDLELVQRAGAVTPP